MFEVAVSVIAIATLLALFIECLERRKRKRNRLANDARLIAKARNERERERDAFLITMYQIVEAEPQMPVGEVIARTAAHRAGGTWTAEDIQGLADQLRAKELGVLESLVEEDRKRAARSPQQVVQPAGRAVR